MILSCESASLVLFLITIAFHISITLAAFRSDGDKAFFLVCVCLSICLSHQAYTCFKIYFIIHSKNITLLMNAVLSAVIVKSVLIVCSEYLLTVDVWMSVYFTQSFSISNCLQCFDTVGWASGKASGL